MTSDLNQQLAKVKHGDHICLIYENAAEQLAAVVTFITEGLARGERCVYITDDPKSEEVVQALKAAGVDVVQERQRGALRLLTSQDTYLRAREFVPQAMIDMLRDLETEALADGFSGLWLTGEPSWSFGPEPGCDRLIEYEALLDQLPTNGKSMILCQYNLSLFGVPCIHDVLRTHPVAILGDQVCPNPYYETPASVLRKDLAGTTNEILAKRVDWWIDQLKRAQAVEQERERALEKLKLSERRLAEAQQIAHIGSWEHDLLTNEVNWSDELYRLFGLQKHEGNLSYEQFLKLVLPQDVDRVRVLVDEAIRERCRFNFDYRIVHADGSVHVMNTRGSVILNEEGEPVRMIGTAQDITELRHAEDELKTQKMILQTIFDHIPVMINFIDSAGRVQMLNRHWERVLGWSLEEAQARDLLSECYPDPEYRARVIEHVRHPAPGWTDFKIRVRDGRTIDTSWALIALPDGTRIGFGQDVTKQKQAEQERKNAEKALRQSEERMNLAVQAADLGIFEHDHQTDNFYWSPMLRSIFGWGANESVSLQAYFGLIHPEDRERVVAAVNHAHALTSDGLFKVEHRLIRPDGGIRWVNVSSRTLFEGEDDSRRPFRTVGIVADITERKRAEKKLREYSESVQALSRRLLEVQEEERRHLARELHDEFGQVLSASTMYLQAARGLAGEAAHPRLDECATLLQQAGEQVRSLSLELRPPMLDTLGLEATLRSLADQHQQRTDCEVQIVGHLSGTTPSAELSIACFRVVQEALTNIVRHAAARHVWIELSQSERALKLVVRDDGVGFDVAPTQPHAARRGRLGLLGMAERVHLLGGRLQVESDPGRGTCITALFLLSKVSNDPAEREE